MIAIGLAATAAASGDAPVTVGASGRLLYHPLETGDRVMDFSYAGYGGGGVALPDLPTQATVTPSGGDDAPAIQRAIDTVSALPLVNGVRGAVQLAPGEFSCRTTLSLEASGVVLRGSGSGAHGTLVRLVGAPHTGINVGGASREPHGPTSGIEITEAHVPAGTAQVSVADGSKFHAGETVAVVRPITPQWVHFMGMDNLERDGKHETWVRGQILAVRTVTEVAGNRLTLDVPLPDDIDRAQMGTSGFVAEYTPAAAAANVGVESLALVAPVQHAKITDKVYGGIRLGSAADAWIRDVAIAETIGTISVGHEARRVTVRGVTITHSSETIGAAKPADFSVDGTQVLVDRCTDTGSGLFYVATGAQVTGPNVILHCVFAGGGWVQPHQRWATGLLVDACAVPGGGIDFMNRGQMGSGHGWTMGWGVAWNCTAKEFLIQHPPGSMNWAVGCTGEVASQAMPFGKAPLLPNGQIVAQNHPVEVASLYLAQLRERLGAAGIAAAGY